MWRIRMGSHEYILVGADRVPWSPAVVLAPPSQGWSAWFFEACSEPDNRLILQEMRTELAPTGDADGFVSVAERLSNLARQGMIVRMSGEAPPRPSWSLPTQTDEPSAPPEEAPQPTPSHFAVFQVVDDASEGGIAKVKMTVVFEDGHEEEHETDGSGQIRLEGLQDKRLGLRSSVDGATLESTLWYAGTGLLGATADVGTTDHIENGQVAIVKTHRVREGQTLESIAEQFALTWEALAQFNFATQDPDEVNDHLFFQVGARNVNDSGQYVFANQDTPGQIHVPLPFERHGLEVDRTHYIRVRSPTTEPRFNFSE